MIDRSSSYRRILETSSIVGSASLVSILIGVLRIKALAVLLGPAGVGLVSLYTNLMSTAAAVASMGINAVGTRQIAEAATRDDARTLAVTRRAMVLLALFLASAGAMAVWMFREVLAERLIGGEGHTQAVGWLAVGVAFSVATASQTALIQGMRRIKDMARLSVYSAGLNTVLGIALLWQWGMEAIWAFVLIGPCIGFVLGHLFASRIPYPETGRLVAKEISAEWGRFLMLGIAFMGAGVTASLVHLWMRVTINDVLGAESVGHFQASWTISAQYIGFALAAMAADYYPRLTGLLSEKAAAVRLVNEQTEAALLLTAPVLVAVVGLAPWIMDLLYSAAFAPAVDLLRWQILGDVLKIASWPLGFLILAAGAGKTFFWTEAIGLLLMGGLVAVLVPAAGLQMAGIAYVAMYLAYLPLVYIVAKRMIGFGWTGSVVRLFLATLACCVSITGASALAGDGWAAFSAIAASISFAIYAIARMSRLTNFTGRLGRAATRARAIAAKAGLIGAPK
jgi:PST family polysaccharide transporter